MVNSSGKFWLPDFDPKAVYVVHAWPAGMTVNGVHPKRGEVFDASSVPEPTLKRMYMDRWLATVDQRPPVQEPEKPEPIEEPASVSRHQRSSRHSDRSRRASSS